MDILIDTLMDLGWNMRATNYHDQQNLYYRRPL